MTDKRPGVLVAGGTGALGGAVLRELAGAGFAVTATWVEERERERVEADLGDAVSLCHADCFELADVENAVGLVEDLAAVVNLIGGFFDGPKVHETAIEDFEGMLRLNLRPAFLLAKVAMPRFVERGGGSFVAVAARTALRPYPTGVAYATAKAAVLAFVRGLDVEYKDAGVRSNAVLPSVIDTPANRAAQPDADFSKWVQPDEIAKVIRFLCSDDSKVTSGAAIPVYGRA